ncbi:hypothetical protein LPTSP4_28100 [Leptospira ryugenii]|uniref:Sulfatase-modifying factor enzyme-like domain-containing protein n=1 Tax=Leptospira ryugenii TaxID=1917863 RepID=A0A2P2E309_9LEPT|nr:hypothetical protein LPTSP4_28100 [Leptospira ryugenii]
MDEESPFSKTKKKVQNWKGEITAVYKNRLWIKIKIIRNKKLSQLSLDEWKERLKEKKEYIVYQKDTKLPIGTFVVRDTIFQETSIPKTKGYFDVIFEGDFRSDPNSKIKSITTDSYIEDTREEDFYVEPDQFYKGRYTKPRESILHPKDKKEMVFVPRGLMIFGQGNDASQDNFNPSFLGPKESNLKEIPSFYIDKYEVTNSEYEYFLLQTNTKPPKHWIGGRFPVGEEDHPVIHLTYREVEAYAKWVGKRLPTEFEWEKAARGTSLTKVTRRDETIEFKINFTRYPFGDEYDSLLCNTRESNINKTVSVYELSKEGASPYGVLGMCGNAAEWTSSWYEVYPGHEIKGFAFGKLYKVIRGGSYSESAKSAMSHHRSYGGIPNLSEDRKAGFRLVMDYRE